MRLTGKNLRQIIREEIARSSSKLIFEQDYEEYEDDVLRGPSLDDAYPAGLEKADSSMLGGKSLKSFLDDIVKDAQPMFRAKYPGIYFNHGWREEDRYRVPARCNPYDASVAFVCAPLHGRVNPEMLRNAAEYASSLVASSLPKPMKILPGVVFESISYIGTPAVSTTSPWEKIRDFYGSDIDVAVVRTNIGTPNVKSSVSDQIKWMILGDVCTM